MKQLWIAAALGLCVNFAFADGVLKPAHGGVMAEAKSGQRVELVAAPAGLEVYLSGHDGKPVDSKGVSGEVTVLAGAQKTTAKLVPAGGNKLTAPAKAAAGAKAIVKIALPGKAVEQVRVALK